MAEIGRLLTAMVTPFDDQGEVDYPQARRLALALLDSGSDGVVVAGPTGEAPTPTPPSPTGTNMRAAPPRRLSRIPNIAGVKEASGNLEQIAAIVEGAREGFRVWSGNDGDTLPLLAVGGYRG